MEKKTTFQINITQRRRRLANVTVVVGPERTVCDGVAWGNANAVPLALGLLIMAAHSFSEDDDIRAALDLALKAYDPSGEMIREPDKRFSARQAPLEENDIPF